MMHEPLFDALRAQFAPALRHLIAFQTIGEAAALAAFAFVVIVIFG